MQRRTDHGESFAEIRERQREYHLHQSTGYHAGRRVFLSGVLALSLFLAVGALAVRQATSPGSARNVLGAGIARVTDLDRLLAQDLPSEAHVTDPAAPALPGFPIDIHLTHADIAGKSTAEVRALVLERATGRVYDDGVHAFDRTGEQSISRFSGNGLLTTMANQITHKNHDRATVALIVLAIISALAAGAVLIVAEEGRRVRLLGTAILAAGLPGLVLSGAAWLILGTIGGGDAFEGALRSLARSVIDVPFRDFAIVSGLGIVVLLAGPLVSLGARPFVGEGSGDGGATDLEASDDDGEASTDDEEDEQVEAGA